MSRYKQHQSQFNKIKDDLPPPSFPDHIDEPAEEKVFNILKTIDSEKYDVFYNRKFAGMRAGEQKEYQTDFLIADKSGGRFNAFLIIEVKGGQYARNGGSISTKYPVKAFITAESD